MKVAEYQRRGLVHLHVLARLDRAMCRLPRRRDPPPAGAASTSELLEQAIRAASPTCRAPVPDELGGGRVRWGDQLDVRQLDAPASERGEIAGYLAKYATKSTEQAGGLLHRIAADEVDRASVREHVRATCAPRSSSTRRRARPAGTAAAGGCRRSTSRPTGTRPALAIRAAARDEPRRARSALRRHDGNDAARPRRAAARRPSPRATAPRSWSSSTAASAVHLADVASIGPANRTRSAARSPRSAAGRVRARVRLPRALPDQEPPLLHHLQAAARRPRSLRARADPRPLHRRHPTRDRGRRGADRRAWRSTAIGHVTSADAYLAA